MKAYGLSSLLVLLAASTFGQTTATQAVRFDVNGNPIPAGQFAESKTDAGGRTVRTEYGVGINGDKVPLSSTEEIKTEQNGHVVVQQVIRHFDQNGNPTSSERVYSDEKKLGESSVEKNTTVYRTDVNGNESVDQRATTRTEGKTTTTNVEKRGLDGSLALAERQTTTTETKPDGSKSESATFRRDNNGNLYEVVKELKETRKQDGQTVESDAKYVVQGDGRFALQERTVTHSVAQADGTVAKTIEVYGEQVPGVTNESGKPALKEIQTVQERKASDGSLIQVTTSQKAEVTGNGRLTSPQVISETVTAKQPD
jgi:hypothetical protein